MRVCAMLMWIVADDLFELVTVGGYIQGKSQLRVA